MFVKAPSKVSGALFLIFDTLLHQFLFLGVTLRKPTPLKKKRSPKFKEKRDYVVWSKEHQNGDLMSEC